LLELIGFRVPRILTEGRIKNTAKVFKSANTANFSQKKKNAALEVMPKSVFAPAARPPAHLSCQTTKKRVRLMTVGNKTQNPMPAKPTRLFERPHENNLPKIIYD
jgi:hypothetical protein